MPRPVIHRLRFGAWWGLVVFLLVPTVVASAASDTLRAPPLLVVRDDENLCLIADGRDSVLYHSIDYITYPSISADGRFIALLEYDRKSFLGSLLSSFSEGQGEVDLLLIDRFLGGQRTLGELKFRRVFEGPASERSWLLFAPLWWQDGAHMIIATRAGVDALHVDGTRRALMALPRLGAIAVTPQRDRCVFTDGKCLWDVTSLDSTPRTLLDSERVAADLGHDNIRALTFSRDGRRLAIGDGRVISLVDVSTHEITKAAKFPDDVYSMAWLANDSGLVVVCGREDQETAMRSSAIANGVLRGSFEVRSWRIGTEKTQKLYSQVDFAVCGVTASLSPDARFLVFSSRHRSENRVLMVLPLDGRKPVRITDRDDYSTPIWMTGE